MLCRVNEVHSGMMVGGLNSGLSSTSLSSDWHAVTACKDKMEIMAGNK